MEDDNDDSNSDDNGDEEEDVDDAEEPLIVLPELELELIMEGGRQNEAMDGCGRARSSPTIIYSSLRSTIS